MSAASNNNGGGAKNAYSSTHFSLEDIMLNKRGRVKKGIKRPRDNESDDDESSQGGSKAVRPTDVGDFSSVQGSCKGTAELNKITARYTAAHERRHAGRTDRGEILYSFMSVSQASLETNMKLAKQLKAKHAERAKEWKAQQADGQSYSDFTLRHGYKSQAVQTENVDDLSVVDDDDGGDRAKPASKTTKAQLDLEMDEYWANAKEHDRALQEERKRA